MTRTRIKICGVRDVGTARAAAEAGADAVGLIFAPASPRLVTLARARQIVAALPGFVEPVALFVNAPLAVVRTTAAKLGIRTVQLHGNESPAYAAKLAPLRVIKAVALGVTTGAELAAWKRAGANLAGLLWDAPAPEAARRAGLTGGGGQAGNWHALAVLGQSAALAGLPPTILAGGLDPDNVAVAVALIRPYAVDVSSGVESRRGVKDPRLIEAFCAAVRAADAFLDSGGQSPCCGKGHGHGCGHHQH
jgi:phosphoribosylanthranilate isomerase